MKTRMNTLKNHYLLFLVLILLTSSCTKNRAKIALNDNSSENSLELKNIFLINQYGDTLNIEKTVLKLSNEHQIELSNLVTGYYTLALDNKEIKLYLMPDSDIHINFDTEDIAFSGKGAEPNNYLKRKYSSEFDWYSNYYETKQTGNKILYFRDAYINKLRKELEQLPANSQFVQTEQKELDYEYFNVLLRDKIMLEINPNTDESIIKDLNKAMSLNVNDSKGLNNSKNFISAVAKILIAKKQVDSLDKNYKMINHPNFKTHFLEALANTLRKELQFGEDDYKKFKTVESFITQQQPSDSIGYDIFNTFNKLHEAEGKLASFSYENVDGEIISLESLRGKYVYIDFWATWCSPCLKEIPYFKKIESQFKGEKIEFVGINVDKLEAKEKWKKKVAQKELLGKNQLNAPLQGYADKDNIDDKFMKLLYVNSFSIGIPQFALIDPKGHIIDAFFYRPSNPKTEKYLSNLLLN